MYILLRNVEGMEIVKQYNFLLLGTKEESAIKRLAKENTAKKQSLKSFKVEKNRKTINKNNNRRKKKKNKSN